MLLKIYSIYDRKIQAYLPPFFMRNSGEATRAFNTTVNDATTNLAKYPHDFELFEVGDFDDASATISTYSVKKSLGLATSFQAKTEPLCEAV